MRDRCGVFEDFIEESFRGAEIKMPLELINLDFSSTFTKRFAFLRGAHTTGIEAGGVQFRADGDTAHRGAAELVKVEQSG